MRVRLRGIYATALTRLCLDADFDVVSPSDTIRERFDGAFSTREHDAAVGTTADRQGVGVSGTPGAVAALADRLRTIGIDALDWSAALSAAAVVDGVVRESRGDGAIVDCGPAEGFLPHANATEAVEAGDRLRVQVVDPAPPWRDDRPVLDATIRVSGGLASLVRDRGAGGPDDAGTTQTASAPGSAATLLDLVATDPPAGWRARIEPAGESADLDALDTALDGLCERAAAVDAALAPGASDADRAPARTDDPPGADDPSEANDAPLETDDAPVVRWRGRATAWVWFGREARFALDDLRRAVVPTMAGHHRIKAGSGEASVAVDFAEAVCSSVGDDPAAFPFGAVADGFGPREGDRLALVHGKPDGRAITLGRGAVTDRDDAGVTLRREMTPGGTYDALGVERRAGDVALTRLREGRWWYQTVYRGTEGERRGTYVNVCTPVELFPEAARYVDLHVDVVKHADGRIERVDDDELDDAVAAGRLSEILAARARAVASAVEDGL
ncbi:RNA-binding protein [Halobacteriales archaeon QS_4_69_34]|nr:MAG: RNA-binding protein [Halobacteriales archaeon QS_4_69_34]